MKTKQHTKCMYVAIHNDVDRKDRLTWLYEGSHIDKYMYVLVQIIKVPLYMYSSSPPPILCYQV
jgi:hypothetical protein